MLLPDGNGDDALADIDPAPLLAPFECFSPSGEVAALGAGRILLGGGAQRGLVDLGITAIHFQFLHPRGFLEFSDVERLHVTIITGKSTRN